MIRHLFVAGLAAGILWASAHKSAAADDPKTPTPMMGGISPQTQKINELIAKKWEEAGIKKVADKANDYEFMRRVFIDLQGRIPTVEEIYDFEQDKAPNKRVRLVQRLLQVKEYTPKGPGGKPVASVPGLKPGPIKYSEGYAKNFAEVWGVWLLTRSGVDDVYRGQLELWLEDMLENNRNYREFVTGLITASGKSNENGAVHFVFRHLGDQLRAEAKGDRIEFTQVGKYDNVPITSRVARLFLGIQIQCAQCHDRPNQAGDWLQEDFWGMNAFFRQTEKVGQQTAMGKKGGAGVGNYVELRDIPTWNVTQEGRSGPIVLYPKRDGREVASYPIMLKNIAQAEAREKSKKKLLKDTPMEGKTRRQLLAEWIVQHDNFEKAYVNRMWGHFFGRGLQKEPTVDDFNGDNDVIHPELLQYLAEQFKQYDHDSKRLLEWICTSDVYQLSHVAVKGLTDVKYDPFFARMPLKAMPPEVLFESLSVATRLRSRVSDEEYNGVKPKDGQPGKPGLKRTWTANLVKNFGDDEGNESNFNGTIIQALLMMNGKDLNNQIKSDKTKGLVADVIKKHNNPAGVYDELFLMTVSRHPTKAEIDKLERVRNGLDRINLGTPAPTGPSPKGPNPPKGPTGPGVPVPGAAPNDVQFYEDVFWALLNTNEFMLNH